MCKASATSPFSACFLLVMGSRHHSFLTAFFLRLAWSVLVHELRQFIFKLLLKFNLLLPLLLLKSQLFLFMDFYDIFSLCLELPHLIVLKPYETGDVLHSVDKKKIWKFMRVLLQKDQELNLVHRLLGWVLGNRQQNAKIYVVKWWYKMKPKFWDNLGIMYNEGILPMPVLLFLVRI